MQKHKQCSRGYIYFNILIKCNRWQMAFVNFFYPIKRILFKVNMVLRIKSFKHTTLSEEERQIKKWEAGKVRVVKCCTGFKQCYAAVLNSWYKQQELSIPVPSHRSTHTNAAGKESAMSSVYVSFSFCPFLHPSPLSQGDRTAAGRDRASEHNGVKAKSGLDDTDGRCKSVWSHSRGHNSIIRQPWWRQRDGARG